MRTLSSREANFAGLSEYTVNTTVLHCLKGYEIKKTALLWSGRKLRAPKKPPLPLWQEQFPGMLTEGLCGRPLLMLVAAAQKTRILMLRMMRVMMNNGGSFSL